MIANDDIEVSSLSEDLVVFRDSSQQFFKAVNHTHDVLLKIAAKSGDRWAIMSYPLGIFTSGEFNDDVAARYPLLMHRHLGSKTGWFRSELTEQEQAQHRAQAYLILERTIGENVANLEYDPITLEDEIKYVFNGGPLNYPRTFRVIMKARSDRLKDQNEDSLLQESGMSLP